MKPLDKKQIPQFAALCVLSAGLAGYLVMHMVAPGPVSAATRPAAKTPAAGPAAAASAAAGTPGAATPGAETADSDSDAPPPSPTMHDPFAVGYVDPASLPIGVPGMAAPALPKLPPAVKPAAGAKLASLGTFGPMPVSVPSAPALPGSLSALPATPPSAGPVPSLRAAPAAPALPAAPTWTVTGVLQGADGKVAILRSGEARRIVRSGDFVDGTYKVTGVSRTSVTLRHGPAVYQLVLGGTKAAPAAPALPAAPMAPAPTPAVPALPRSAAALSNTLPTAHAPAKVAKSISLGLRLLDGSVLASEHKE